MVGNRGVFEHIPRKARKAEEIHTRLKEHIGNMLSTDNHIMTREHPYYQDAQQRENDQKWNYRTDWLPTRGRILVRLMEGAKLSETIIAPECVTLKFGMAEVLAIGPNKRDEEGNERLSQLQIGDVIYFGQFKDFVIGETAFIMEDDVILRRCKDDERCDRQGIFNGEGWHPLHDRIIVKPALKSHTIGRLRAPDKADRETDQGVVIACGTGQWREGTIYPLQCRPGDGILFWAHSKQEFTLNGEKLYVMRDEDVLGKLDAHVY